MIRQTRHELATLLEATGHTVEPYVPDELAPPAYVLQPADPFVFEQLPGPDGLTFGEGFVIGFDVILCVELGDEHDNEQASDQLDGMIEDLLDAVRESEWFLDSMGQPGPMVTSGWVTHGQRVTLQRRVNL